MLFLINSITHFANILLLYTILNSFFVQNLFISSFTFNFCVQPCFECVFFRDFPGGPVVNTSPSNAGDAGLIPGQEAKNPHASQPRNQNIKQKQYCNKFNKDFKNGPHQKNLE